MKVEAFTRVATLGAEIDFDLGIALMWKDRASEGLVAMAMEVNI